MQNIPPEQSLIEYPSDFPIKVMGRQHPELAQLLTEVVLQHDPGFDPATVEMRPSKGGNYIGLTFTVRATSREQLDALYRALHGHPMVSVVL
ncbi:Proposed lipoate regulatory protein YbeD [plant metagenome]|uniref:Proposed lipoate regulatory protein YbeD n=1 Tax=plant metagenome TaxID=1297885 RepID=A0A484V9S6_9ZZZZ